MATHHDVHKTAAHVPGSMTIVVLGASGDLAKRKTFPALFDLYTKGLLPQELIIVGYARSAMDDAHYKKQISSFFKPREEDKKLVEPFLKMCTYAKGSYDNVADFKELDKHCSQRESTIATGKPFNRTFYLALPPSVFLPVCKGIKEGCMSTSGYNRVIVEKPFGKDLATSDALQHDLSALFTEEQLYRIDHYLGKEVVQNLIVLRFANLAFSNMWNRNCIANVQITFKEDIGVEGRGGYFDEYGIIRDVMQNHLLQILALVAMERPVSLSAEDVRDEKVKVLKCIAPIKPEDIITGQYSKSEKGPGYLEDPTIPKNSVTPTFAIAALHVHNERWEGVPFILKCGKGLNDRKAEIRIQLRNVPGNMGYFPHAPARNEIVIRVQPDEAIYMKFTAKAPGLSVDTVQTELDMTFKSRFKDSRLPDAYERLIHDVLRGDHRDFVRADELHEAWKIFTPVLHHLEQKHVVPEQYPFGSRGPASADKMVENLGYNRRTDYVWVKPQ